ncbi:MAG: hypothetical protein WDZ51_18275 [Pirellulaceae bacterium]
MASPALQLRFWGMVIIALTLGCSNDDSGLSRVDVSGVVHVNGEPLPQGHISFKPQPGTPGPSVGAEVVQGSFQIPQDRGPSQGVQRVEIRATRPTGRKLPEGSGSETPDRLVEETEQYVPEKYNRKSTLTADLNAAKIEGLEFQLEIP